MSSNKHRYILLNYAYALLYQIFEHHLLVYCLLFIWIMQSVNGAQFLNITFLLVLFTAAPAAVVFGTVIFPLRRYDTIKTCP